MKNWCNYKDTIGIEENVPHKETRRVLRADELPIFLGKPEEREEWEKRNNILPELAVTEQEITAD